MTRHTTGIYHSAISASSEPHHKATNHPAIFKLTCNFYLQHLPSCKQFHPWDVKHLLSLLESWAPASSLTSFKLAWKTDTLLALVTANCSDFTLLCDDNQHIFLQYLVIRLIGKVIFHFKFILKLTPVLILPLSFAWRFIYAILSLLGRSQMDLRCLLYF